MEPSLPLPELAPDTLLAEFAAYADVALKIALFGLVAVPVGKPGLEIPKPALPGDRFNPSPVEIALALPVVVFDPPGVAGDSVPALDFLAPDRGVTFPFNSGD